MSVQTLNYRETGTGEPVVLLHGMLGSSLYWKEIIGLLEHDYQVVAPDLLGFGRSPKPENSDYSRDTHIEYVISTLDSINISKPIILVGHSMGALIALGLAVKYPMRISKLVLISMPIYKDIIHARREIVGSGIVPSWMYYGPTARMICSVMCMFRPLAKLLTPFYFKHVPKDIAQEATLHTWYSYSRSMTHVIENQNVLEDLKELSIDTTLMFGTKDTVASHENLQALKNYGDHITVKILQATHQLPLEYPERVIDAIKE